MEEAGSGSRKFEIQLLGVPGFGREEESQATADLFVE